MAGKVIGVKEGAIGAVIGQGTPKTAYILMLCISIMTLLYAPCWADVIDDLVPLIIQAESSGNTGASDGKSFGLMGISPCVLQDYKADVLHREGEYLLQKDLNKILGLNAGDLFNPNLNVQVGTWYLHKIQSWLPEGYKNSKPHICAAYNWGIGNLRKNNWKIPKSFKNHPNKIYRRIFRGEL